MVLQVFLLPGRGKSARSKPGSGTAYIDIKGKERKSGSWLRPILLQYAKDKYGLTEAAATDSDYIEQMRCLKENLVLRQKPELLGSLGELPEPDLTDETAVQGFLDLLEARSRKIAQLPDDAVPMDFHLYKIKMGDGLLQMGIDYIWQDLSLSYSGNRAAMRKFKKTAEDLYRFYGVSVADIQNHSARYTALVSALCS